ncbi:MAG: hypothetical protein EXR76_04355 [Myxococcales bacterium]|nr:hypothetical protein [Myxococcales bacterium]
MRRSAFIEACLHLTLAICVSALVLHLWYRDPLHPAMAGQGKAFALMSPVFVAVASKKAIRLGRATGFVAALAVLLAAGGLFTVVMPLLHPVSGP